MALPLLPPISEASPTVKYHHESSVDHEIDMDRHGLREEER